LTGMKKQKEYANSYEENILSVLAKTLVVFLLLVIAIGCRSTATHIPLIADLAIAQADTYKLLVERELFLKYKSNLESIYQKVRACYSAGDLEFFIVYGMYFGSPEDFPSQDKYLAVNIKTSKLFHDSNTPFDKRTAQIFSKYIKPLLKIIAEEKKMLDDPLIAGVALGVRWQAKKPLMGTYEGEVDEQIQFIVLKDILNRYLGSKLTDQQLLTKSSIYLLNEARRNQKIIIKLE
jgi:hypothetical protein